MKIIDVHKILSPTELMHFIDMKLNPLFKEQRHEEIKFRVETGMALLKFSSPNCTRVFCSGLKYRAISCL